MGVAGSTLRRYQLLGDVRAYEGETVLSLGASKPRSLLAILLLRAGSVVPTDVVCDLLWSGQPPPSAAATLHGYVSALRRALGPESIRTESPGYVIHLEPDQLDTARFAELVATGRGAAEAGQPDLAARALREALELWRGDALAGVADQPWAVEHRARLEEARLSATEDWARVELQLGRHAEIVEALQTAVRGAPLREDLRARLALALYRSGRQADALQTIAEGRLLLVQELGIDPGAELVELQSAMLAQDPALDRHRYAPGRPSTVHQTATAPPDGTTFVGRDRELAELRHALDQAFTGSPRVVVLAGEPGIGKTELARVVAAEAERRGGVAAWGRCHEGAGAPAYWPWAEITDTLVRRVGGAEVDAAAGVGIADLAALGAELLPGQQELVDVDPQAARFRTGRALTGLLGNLSRRVPLLLVVDDLQWADPPSLELLGSVVRALSEARVLIVCTMRTGGALSPELTRTLAELARTPYRRLELGGLDEDAVGQLVAARVAELSADDVAQLLRRTAGNPLFVTQLASWMGGRSSSTSRLPAEVGDVVRDRIYRLANACAAVLSDASILGTELDIDNLRGVTGLDAEALLEGLAPALDAGLLVADDLPGRWRFVHGVVAETLRADLSPDRSARLHLRAATRLTSSHGGRRGPHLSAVAAHLVEAAPLVEPAQVVAALVEAGTWNAEHLAFEQAYAQVDRAVDVLSGMSQDPARDGAELGIQSLRTQLILTTSGYGSSQLGDACRRMRVLCGRLESGSGNQMAPVLWRLTVMHGARCEFEAALETGQQLATLDGGSPASVLLSHMALGSVYIQLGDISTAGSHFDAAIAGLPASREDVAWVVAETPDIWISVFTAWCRWATGDRAGSERDVDAALEAGADQGVGTYPHAFALWSASLFAVLHQEPEQALDFCERGIPSAQTAGFGMLAGFMRATRGWAIGRTGDVDLGISEIETAMELTAASGLRDFRHVFPAFLADTHLWAGRPDEAALHARTGLEAADDTGERWYEAELHRLLGVALAETDRPAALGSLRRAVTLADTQGNVALAERARRSLEELDRP